MGIWPIFWQPPYRKYFGDMFGALYRFATNQRSGPFLELLGHLDSFERFFWKLPSRMYEGEWTDALDDLHQWPVPLRLARGLSSRGNNNNPTLLNFLAAFLANPPAINGSPSFVPEIDLALFAAARLVAPCSRNWADHAGTGSFFDDFHASESVQRWTIVRLAEAAWAWLAEQLPHRGFGPALEQAIEQTSGLVAAEEVSGAHPDTSSAIRRRSSARRLGSISTGRRPDRSR